jgi:hypothetical protein
VKGIVCVNNKLSMKKMIFFVLVGAGFCFSCTKKDCRAMESNDCVCTLEYEPVCGCDGETYGNKCIAECHNILEYSMGACSE